MGLQNFCDGCRYHVEPTKLIMTENLEAYRVFLICHRQWRAGFNGIYSLDGNFVWKVMEDIGVVNKTEAFSRVDTLAAHYLEAMRKK